jgi:delta-aminolevulinic acid dehydratase/porphobilinogen synthase
MSIGSVKANFDRLSVERINQFQQLKREAAEAKLYYLRDTHAPEEFDKLVDEELHRADTIIVEPNISLKDVIRTVKKKMSCLSKRKIS